MYAQIRLASSRAAPRGLVQRRLASTLPPPPPPAGAAGAAAASIPPKPKSKFFRRLVTYTVVGALVFYPVSAYVSTKSEAYRDLFVQVPGGEALADYADEQGWDQLGVGSVTKGIAKATSAAKGQAEQTVADAKVQVDKATKATEKAVDSAKAEVKEYSNEVRAAAAKATALLKKEAEEKAAGLKKSAAAVEKSAADLKDKAAGKATEAKDAIVAGAAVAKDAVAAVPAQVQEAVSGAEEKAVEVVKASTNPLPDTARPRELRPDLVKPQKRTYEGQEVYDDAKDLPLGFEPPPGYYIPPPPPKKVEEEEKLPLLAPQVKDYGVEEPIIAQLASTIDSLTESLSSAKGGPSAEASDILSKAQGDLTSLYARVGEVKKSEKENLEKTIAAKQAEFEAALKAKQAEFELEESTAKEGWEAERQKMLDGWRAVLDNELEQQRKGIEERLREEVVSQGIELQRRWLRSIKAQVETERGGRLAKLDSLTTSLKQLERITLDNSAVLDDNVRLHKIWSALRAVQAKVERGDQSFDNELRVLQQLTAVEPGDDDDRALVGATLASLEASGVAQSGVKSFASLSSWFANSVSPAIQAASLVPAPEEASVASHLASATLSKLLFRPKAGLVEGADVAAVLARAEWALAEKDLDAAAREVNQLTGWPRKLAADWLREARRKLEVQQALEVVGTEATLSSLLLV